MKKLKLGLNNVTQLLSREQMKQIIGGSGGLCDDGCAQNSDCGTTQLCVDVNCPSDPSKVMKGCIHQSM